MNLDGCTRTANGYYVCEEGNQRIYVQNIYPPIQELQPKVLFVVAAFLLFFIVGICGNASILTIIRGIVSERKNARVGGINKRRESADNAILYIGALCIVDFLMSLSLPPAILDSIIGFWMFGTVICKLHHVFGSVGRIVSTFLITAMSFDRYVAVCHPYKSYYRSRKFIISTIIALWGVAFILLLPMLTYASSTEVPLTQHRVQDTLTGGFNITRVRVYKCSDMMPSYVFYWFTCSTFALGYVVPLVLIIFFNTRLIRKLCRHTKIIKKTGIPLKRIAIYTILIAVVYFLVWTPYWCSVLYAIYMNLMQEQTEPSPMLVFIIYCIHLLPYAGSASNWILYGLLNTQLQVRHETYHINGSSNAYNTNLVGSGSQIVDDNISLPNLNQTAKKSRDGFLDSPENNRSRNYGDRNHNGSTLHNHNVASLTDLEIIAK